MPVVDARVHLLALVGQDVRTITGRRNTVIALDGANVIVGTTKSPAGQPVPIEWVQHAMDILARDGEVTIDVETVGYRSAFIGAVLATLPDASVASSSPLRIMLKSSWVPNGLGASR